MASTLSYSVEGEGGSMRVADPHGVLSEQRSTFRHRASAVRSLRERHIKSLIPAGVKLLNSSHHRK
jgi:hypothetical protein